MSDCVTRQLGRRQVKSLFVSDLHLGARGSRAGKFLEFLRQVDAEEIFLVGDILDVWHCGTVQWGATHDAIMDELKRRARNGTRVVYLPGNHDAELRKRLGHDHEGLQLVDQLTHVAADGTRYLVLHGDQCDSRILRWHVMTRIGTRLDAWLRGCDAWARDVFHFRTRGETERNLVELVIHGVSALLMVGNKSEKRLAELAIASDHDGVICGHFHKPALRDAHGIRYANCGDWVDSMTALVELFDGRLQLLDMGQQTQVAGVPAASQHGLEAQI
ncbi:UDP-2,3-diacylglucosamine hydrolase [Thioclava sp. SK-1]|uniref:UDP-2,3-diacylglucosamine diphosphatase n=1 Tax=Thioclava sp. SK-1 TaxID=1889770 RepID=UPI000825E13E|nr:UDP-2,3-diacylglucosamine diphosphatase [Thioclava sp. SK-1]OCX66811.1 UDP-2,3-diacylglucosamine hydrolase [Thioclava sp. SK-1]